MTSLKFLDLIYADMSKVNLYTNLTWLDLNSSSLFSNLTWLYTQPITERKNTAENLFLNEVNIDMKHLSYVFILNHNSFNISDNSLTDTLN